MRTSLWMIGIITLGLMWPSSLAAQAPPNTPAKLDVDLARGQITLSYSNEVVLNAAMAIEGPSGERTRTAKLRSGDQGRID
jgi:hypothetical protein